MKTDIFSNKAAGSPLSTKKDNIIADREGQKEAYLPPGTNVDLTAVLASDDGFLSISAQRDVTSVEALIGHTGNGRCHDHGVRLCAPRSSGEIGRSRERGEFERAGGVANRFRAMFANSRPRRDDTGDALRTAR